MSLIIRRFYFYQISSTRDLQVDPQYTEHSATNKNRPTHITGQNVTLVIVELKIKLI